MSFVRIKTINGTRYQYEVENYRDEQGKVRQRILRYLGKMKEVEDIKITVERGLAELLELIEETELWNDPQGLKDLPKCLDSIAHGIRSRITELETLSGEDLEKANLAHQVSRRQMESNALSVIESITKEIKGE